MEPKIVMAPMSGVTDLSFRLICREFGARLCYFEMLDSKALIYGHRGTRRLLKTVKKDSPIAAQLLGGDPSVMLEAAELLTGLVKISSLDINAACPAPKVIRKKAGAQLLDDPERLGKIVKRLASAINIPVTVKMRSGRKKSAIKDTLKIAGTCEASGASKIFIHGRTAGQGYSGDVDYASIKAVKESLRIPVWGSGNIFSPPLAKKMLDETGCDGLLAARGSMGNPWIFKDVEDYLKTGRSPKERSGAVKKKVLKKHLLYIEKFKEIGPAHKMGFMNKVAMWYLRSFYNAKRLREEINRTKSYKELIAIINAA
jgi:tRNA-dihydrouridine synthase B